MNPIGATAPRSRYSNSGTFTHPNGTTKQVVVTLLAATFGGFGRCLFEIDCAALTKNSNICGLETSTDGGSTWAPVPGQSFTSNVAQHPHFDVITTDSVRVVLTSGANEGASRLIPWKIDVM